MSICIIRPLGFFGLGLDLAAGAVAQGGLAQLLRDPIVIFLFWGVPCITVVL